MTTTLTCNVCGKELERNWIEIKHIYKDRDFGYHMTVMEVDVCSKECANKCVEKHYKPREKFYD